MKKLMILLCLGAVGFGLTSCGENNNNNNTNPDGKVSFMDMYSLSAISGINMLNTVGAAPKMRKNAPVTSTTVSEDTKNEIIAKLELIENVISDELIKTNESASDKAEYQKMYTISTKDMQGEAYEYTFYYNETDVTAVEEADVDDDDDDKDDVNDKDVVDDKDDNEKEMHLSGIVISNDVTYQMIGNKEVENDEMEIAFKVLLDEKNYVVIEQEIEAGEEEYSFASYKNGVLEHEYEMEFEIDPNTHKVEVEFEETTNAGERKIKFESMVKDNQKIIEVKIEENKQTQKYIVTVTEDEAGNKTYNFA